MVANVLSKLSTMASLVHHYGSIFLWMLLFAIVACLGVRAIVMTLWEQRLQSLEDENWNPGVDEVAYHVARLDVEQRI